MALVLRCLEAALQLPQVCSQKLTRKRLDGCHGVLASNLNSTNEYLLSHLIQMVFEQVVRKGR